MHTKKIDMISLVIPYFEDKDHLKRFLETQNLDCFSEVIIIDDGSELHQAAPIVREYDIEKIRVLRVPENLGFNAHGCRNLGVQQAKSEWCLLMDIDKYIPESTVQWLDCQIESLPERIFLGFLHTEKDYREGCDYSTYMIRTKDFLSTRGYDEEFVNIHGGSRVFVQRLKTILNRITLDAVRVTTHRGGRELVLSDQERTTYDDKFIYQPHTWDRVDELLDMAGKRNENPDSWKDKTFVNFEWYEEIL